MSHSDNPQTPEKKDKSNINRRRTLLIKKPLQMKFMLFAVFGLLVLGGILISDVYLGFDKLDKVIDVEFNNVMNLPANQPGIFSNEEILVILKGKVLPTMLQQQIWMMLIKIIVFSVLITWLTLHFSHKLAGPIYRFEQSCKTVAQGNLKLHISLRKGRFLSDDLEELKDQFNDMIASLHGKVQSDRSAAKEVSQKCEDILSAGNCPAELAQAFREIKYKALQITSGFTI